VRDRVRQSIATHEALLADDDVIAAVATATDGLTAAFRGGGKLLCFGNGGSASDAQHIAGEFVARFFIERPGLPAIALGANFPVSSAIANDYDYERVFARQVEALGTKGDVALGLTTSGRSKNVIAALTAASERGLMTIALAGRGPDLLPPVDHLIRVPSTLTPRIQECHILIGHILSELVEAALFGPGGGTAA
jgi:D-sedoheptulose 7-phosphate isomerase